MEKNNYNGGGQGRKIYLVLVPHRDVRLVLRKYSGVLFRAGFEGAYLFPWVAPLAVVSQALNDAELKNISRALREAAGSKISANKAALCSFGEDALYGPLIDIDGLSDVHKEAAEKVTEIFPHPVIGSCLLPAGENAALLPVPELSFRAAAAANMYWSRTNQSGEVSVKWKIGKLCWLPAKVKSAQSGGANN